MQMYEKNFALASFYISQKTATLFSKVAARIMRFLLGCPF
jgi:hypothetical protein